VRAAYRFRDAALIAEKKNDFGRALQNLYRELEGAENVVGPSNRPVLFDRSALKNLGDSFARAADHDFMRAMEDQIDYNSR
jgi:hypothetical protein